MKKSTIVRVSLLLLILGCAAEVRAQAWKPEKPVEIVVPTVAAGINDRLSRLMQRVLQEEKIVNVRGVVMNKPGGYQSLAVVYMSERAGDTHYLFYSTASFFITQLAELSVL